mmetsp:Transcript_4656/g.6438  ORF Transcript_4656/g.6438 Transcript_4656/m.6438 type:complete len:219 (+) Transcript_4656:1321-1977(+)
MRGAFSELLTSTVTFRDGGRGFWSSFDFNAEIMLSKIRMLRTSDWSSETNGSARTTIDLALLTETFRRSPSVSAEPARHTTRVPRAPILLSFADMSTSISSFGRSARMTTTPPFSDMFAFAICSIIGIVLLLHPMTSVKLFSTTLHEPFLKLSRYMETASETIPSNNAVTTRPPMFVKTPIVRTRYEDESSSPTNVQSKPTPAVASHRDSAKESSEVR